MSVKFNQSMVRQCYDNLNDEIRTLERKKEQALVLGAPIGYQLAKTIDGQIKKKREELQYIKYALNNMT